MNKWQQKNLLKKIKSGDENSFAKVYDLYVDKIYKFVFLKINSHEAAEEIVQDIFLRLWQFSQKEDSEVKSLNALIYRIARNLIIDFYRSQNIEEPQLSIDDYESSQELSTNPDHERIDIQFDMEAVVAAIKKLPGPYREIVIMKFVNELSNKEISQILDKSEGNIRVLSHRALTALKHKLKSNG